MNHRRRLAVLPVMVPLVVAAQRASPHHRVIVVDPKTNRIVWQYGETRRPGREPGRLNTPDGLDLAPPHSLLMRHAATMGTP